MRIIFSYRSYWCQRYLWLMTFFRKIYYDYFFICCLINQNLIKLWYCLATWCQLYLRRLTTLWNSCSNQQKTIGYERKHDAKEVCKSSWRKVLVSNVRGNGIIQNLIEWIWKKLQADLNPEYTVRKPDTLTIEL